jgi:hypothetical protein
LHRLETLNWTVHGSHLSSSSPQACCSLNEDTLEYVSWVSSYIMTAYSCHLQKCDRNSRQILYHAVLKILSRFLYSIYWSTATVGRWSSQWIVNASWWKWRSETLWPHHLTRLWLHSLLLYLQLTVVEIFLQFCRYVHSLLNRSW